MRKSRQHVLGLRAVDEVVVQRAVRRGEGHAVAALAAEVEEGAEGVVEEHADGAAAVHLEEEGNRLVDGIGGLLPAEAVRVPHREGLAGAVQRTRLVAQPEEMVVWRFGLCHREAVGRPCDGQRIALEDVAAQIGDGQPEAGLYRDAQRGSTESMRLRGHRNARGTGLRQNGPGGVLGRMASRPEAHPEDVGSQRVDPQDVVGFREFDPAARVRGDWN